VSTSSPRPELAATPDLTDIEARWRERWERDGIYRWDADGDGPVFSVDTPPPYVSAAHLHVGHAMSYAQADFVIRYQRMRGARVYYPIGFDDNGLPTERYVERKYGIDKASTSRSEFRQLCLEETASVAEVYEDLWRALGLSLDWSQRYSTIDDNCRRTAQTAFVRLHEHGRIYRTDDPVFWDPVLGTALAQADLEMLERTTRLYDIAFTGADGQALVISTTRPELLPACVAMYCHPEDSRYEHLIGSSAQTPLVGQEVPILTDEEVDPEFGTGVCDEPDESLAASGEPGHLERVEDHVGLHVRRDPPPDDAAGERVDDEAHIGHPRSRGHIGEVGHPQGVGPLGGEVAVDQVWGAHRVGVGDGGEHLLATPGDPFDPEFPHQPCHLVPPDLMAGPARSLPELVRAVDLAVGHPQRHQHLAHHGVSDRAGRRGDLTALGRVVSASRRTDRRRHRRRAARHAGDEPMSAVVAAEPVEAWFPSNASSREWAVLSARTPQLVATMRCYLLQLSTFLAPRSVEVADTTLRQMARWVTTETNITIVADIERRHIEDYKVWLAAQPGQKGNLLANNTQRHRLRMIRIFLERLIEWDWPDAPGRNPILHGDIPPRSEPIPKFLTDQQAAAFMAAARAHPVARYRLVAQVLARTGLRASELCELAGDAVTKIGNDSYWLRVPVGKLRNDRMIPLHPEVVELFAEWTATNNTHIRATRRLLADDHLPIDRRTVHRIVARIGAIAGIHDMHPTGSATRSPPKPSTAECASKPSPRCWVTARSR
jgi:site-specific recombinase XerD